MNLQINWSNQAEKNYNAILDEVEMEWGKNTLAKLVKRVNGILQGISQFPKMYPKHSTENIRKAVINKHISLYYQINDNEIELICFWNNHRNPDDLPL